MAVVVMVVIIMMSIVLGAELGPKADPTTTTYVPRPEWYFFFLFEVLRVDQAAVAHAAGDDRRADDLHDPAVPAAVLRPRPRAPARSAARSPRSPASSRSRAMAFLTYEGANAGSPNEIDMKPPTQRQGGGPQRVREGQAGGRAVRLPGLPQDRRERQRRPRAAADDDRATSCPRRPSRGRCATRPRRCRRSRTCRADKFKALVDFLGQLKSCGSP